MGNLEDKLKELKKGYLKKLESLVLDFKFFLETIEQADINELYSKVHTISGTSGMYGLTELSEFSTEFELYLKENKDNIDTVNKIELREKLFQYIKEIEKIIIGD